MSIDPFVVEVIRHGLTAAAEEMSLTVMRAARSPLLREAGDLSSAITDRDGELIAQGRDIPIHIGTMSFTVKDFVKWVPRQVLQPGDVWFTNHPQCGGNHLPDVKAIRPLFHEGELYAFAISLAHWSDVGGAWPGSYFTSATDSIQEGLRIPPIRLFSTAGPDREKLGLILANVRGTHLIEGDIHAQVAATRTADLRLAELVAEHGLDTLLAAIERLHDLSEAQLREAIRGLPDGEYEGTDWIDDGGPDGRPAAVRVTVRIRGDEAEFDYTASDDAVDSVLNTTPLIASAATMYAIKAVAGPDIHPNGGCYRPVSVKVRPGSLLDPGPMRPIVGGNHETSQRIGDAVFRALEAAVPDRLTAGGSTTAGLLIFSGAAADGRWITFYEVHGGGEGARIDRDGCPAVRVHMTNTANTPSEIVEAEYPIRVARHGLRRGSGGAGAHAGGDGVIREYEVLADALSLTTMFDRAVVPPYGLCGGEAGTPFRATLHRADGTETVLPGKANIRLRRGDRVVMETSGGGGYGRPA